MKKQVINPWEWQNDFGFVQANDISGAQRMLLCSGQVSVDENGAPVHAGDMSAQIAQALDNLETVLGQAGLALSDVVRIKCYTTDISATLESWGVLAGRLGEGGSQTALTLIGVAALFHPDILVEIEATVVR